MKFWRTGLILLAVQMSAVLGWGQAIEVDNLRSLTLNFSGAAGQPCAGCVIPVVVTTSNSEIPLAFSVTTTPSWLSVSSTQNIASPQQAASFTVMADTTGLPAGIYGGTITLACDEGFTCTGASITVNLIINGADLSASPNPYDVTIATGSSPAVGVALTGAASISASVTSGASFIQAPPGSVSSPGTLMLLLNQSADLSPGLHTGTVLLTCVNGTFCLALTVTINITVKTALNIDPNKLSFTAVAGQPATCSSPYCLVTVDSTAAFLPAVTVSASTVSGGNWLTAGAQSLGENIQFNVSASAVGLQAGTYSGTITAACSGDCIGASITVTLTVTAAPTLSAGAVSKTLTALAGQTQAQCGSNCTASFTLSASSGSLMYQFSSTTNSAFSVSPTSGTATTAGTSITVTANPASLTPGTYAGTLVFGCAAPSSCAQVSVVVNLTVTAAPALSAGTVSKKLMATAGQTQTQCGASCMASFPLSASSGSLTYQIAASSTGNWLGVSPTSGTATATATSIMVTANPAGLAANTYTGMLTINCTAPSSCSTAQVSVTFTVNASAPTVTLTASPASVSFSAVSGRGNPAAKMVIVSASDGSAQAFTVSNVPAWLGVSPLSGTTGQASAALTLTPNAGAAPQSGVSGSFTITPSNGSAAVNVAVSLAFSAFSISANPASLTIGVQAGGTASQTLAIGTIDGGSAAVSVSVSGSSAVTLSSQPTTVPANITVNANAAALQAGSNAAATITIACAAANPCTALTVPVQLNVTAGGGPIITPNGIVPLFSTATTVQTGEWISIYGTNLNPGTFLWKGDFPQSLGGTMVKIDGKNGYLSFVGPTQINVQVPDDSNTGTVEVTVNSPNGSATSTVTLGQFGPALSLLGDNKHAAGIIYRFDGSGTQGGGTYDIIGPTGTSLGFATVAAKAGDVIALFGVGFGATTPPVPAGQPFSGQTTTNSTVTLLIDNVGIQPLTYSGLSGAGLYQFNFVLPAGLGTGDVAVQAMVGGVSTQANVAIALQ